jgi:hypothetical protein
MANIENNDGGLRELALFAGAGGGILGGKLLGWRTVCAVEWEPYPRAVLKARMLDGILPFFPIFEDVRFICFDSIAKIMYDTRYYEVRQTSEGLPESSGNVCGGTFNFRGCQILRKNPPSDVGMDESQKYSDEAEHPSRKRKSLSSGRENLKRLRAESARNSDPKGIVERKTYCEQCGNRGRFKDGRNAIQAHHPDYNDPLRVMWLCQKCHHEWHKNFKAIERR